MLIRSQDKKLLVNLDTSSGLSIGVRGDGGNHVVTHHGTDRSYNFLGYYSTEEKATKVLDMIQSKYLEYYHLKGRPAILKGSIDVEENMWEVPKVFIMPADEEVEV